jgi:hypothetical protein
MRPPPARHRRRPSGNLLNPTLNLPTHGSTIDISDGYLDTVVPITWTSVIDADPDTRIAHRPTPAMKQEEM